MRMCAIASGSSGNCIYVGTEGTHLLIDAGISGKRVEGGVNALDLSMHDIDGILVTHEHIDHIQGLGVLARRYHIPIYATKGTIKGIKGMKSLGEIDDSLFNEIKTGEKFSVKEITAEGIQISHDAYEPCGFKFEYESSKSAVITDLGCYDEIMVDKLKNLNALYLEANHDVHMLQVGPYPYPLKMRILGNKGHLCNENAGKLISLVASDKLKTVVLSHLSKENNYPDLAYETVRLEVTASDTPFRADDFDIQVARRTEISNVVNF